MKCRVCGYEFDPEKTYCPMCGTKVIAEVSRSFDKTTEMAWNTKDFPKPKELEDIDMNWGKGMKSFMTQDASEGFVSIEKPQFDNPVPKKEEDPFELPGAMRAEKPAYEAASYEKGNVSSSFDAWKMPPQEELPKTPLWYTQNFTASGVMKTGPAFPIAQGDQPQAPVMPTAATAAAALSASMPDATIQYMRVDPPKPVYTPDYDSYKPDYESAPAVTEKKPEKFNTFITKNEEFQKLLDREYERIQAIHASDTDPIPSVRTMPNFESSNRVLAQNINDFEKTIMSDEALEKKDVLAQEDEKDDFVLPKIELKKEEPKETPVERAYKSFEDLFTSKEEPKLEPAYKAFAYESDETDLDLDELIADPLNPNFDINTIEMTIKQLEEAEEKFLEKEAKIGEEKKSNSSKLEAMRAARDAYFKFLDEKEEDIKISKKFDKKQLYDATPIFADDEAAQEETEEAAVVPAKAEDNTVEINEDEVKTYGRKISDTAKLPEELVGLYDYEDDDDYEDDEDDKPRRHGFLRFLLGVVIVIAIFEATVLALQNFLPEAGITAQVTDIHSAMLDAITNAVNKIGAILGSER